MGLGSLFSKKNKENKTEEKKSEKIDTSQELKQSTVPVQNTNEPPVAAYLEQAIIENARKDIYETRAKVYQELLFSDLLLALSGEPQVVADQQSVEVTNQNINIAILANQEGVQFAAAFTSSQAARRWRVDGGHYVSIRGQDIFRLLEGSPAEVIVINPGSAPFVALTKIEYRQLAAGIIPKSPNSPVQMIVDENEQQPEAGQGLQISFPADAFSSEQKHMASDILLKSENVEAAAVGAILPPNAPKDAPWVRTIFLRTHGIEENQEQIQKFCNDVRENIRNESSSFKEFHFEIGVMPDPNFWVAMHQNNFILFDKNPANYLTQNT